MIRGSEQSVGLLRNWKPKVVGANPTVLPKLSNAGRSSVVERRNSGWQTLVGSKVSPFEHMVCLLRMISRA